MTAFLTGVGRIVQGSPFRLNVQKDKFGKPKLNDAGEEVKNCFIAVAFRKDDQDFLTRFYPMIVAEAKAGWPEYFNADGSCKLRDFAFKVADGDGVDDTGKDNKLKPGWAGHWIVKFSNGFLPQVFHKGNYEPMNAVRDENALKLGYYVRVSGDMKGNRPSQSPGVYMNFNMVEITAQCPPEQVIVLGPDANAVFGAAPVTQLPAGAIAITPGTPAALPGPGTPAVAAPARPGPTTPATLPPTMTAAPVQTPTYVMTAAAEGYTREQYHDQHWTDDALIAAGKMVASGPKPPNAPAAPSMPNGPASPVQVAPAPVAVSVPSSPGSMPVVPNANFVANALATPTYTMTAAAQGFSHEQYLQQGYSDDQLIAAGFMVKS